MWGKEGLRAAALSRRARMPLGRRAEAGSALAVALEEVLAPARRVAAYASVGTEPSTQALLLHCSEVLLPVLLPGGDLDWALAGHLVPTGRGLLEPSGPRLGVDAIAGCDVVLVPALTVDRLGTRLGRGGGSYDRALRRATGLTIALLYDGETSEVLPVEPHDVPVGAVATPGAGLVRVPF